MFILKKTELAIFCFAYCCGYVVACGILRYIYDKNEYVEIGTKTEIFCHFARHKTITGCPDAYNASLLIKP
jgi:hypothetical protein